MNLIALMPYGKDFLFVDQITEVNQNFIKGYYRFSSEAYFYKHHFPNQPVTPGVFLLESAAQIGLVAFGIHLLGITSKLDYLVAFTSSQVDFLKPVQQGEEIFVEAKKIYFRFNKLKVSFVIKNIDNQLVASGELSGMFHKK